ncbi:MAG: hypothetical protein WCF03_18835 [Nitrososphaeraceae archaeon]
MEFCSSIITNDYPYKGKVRTENDDENDNNIRKVIISYSSIVSWSMGYFVVLISAAILLTTMADDPFARK